MQANVPHIAAFPGDAFGINNSLQGESITFRAANCTIAATPDEVSSSSPYYKFNGAYASGNTEGWVLNSAGGSFLKQDNVSMTPFHAYLSSERIIGASNPKTLIISGNAPTSLNESDAEKEDYNKFQIVSTTEGVTIIAKNSEEVTIYNIMGVAISRLKLDAGSNLISDLPCGTYFINEQKFIVQ